MQNKNQIHFYVLQLLLLVSYMFHQTESWDFRYLALYSIFCVAVFFKIKKFHSLFFTVASLPILYHYFKMFPNLANHSNLSFFVFLFIFPYSVFFSKKITDSHYDTFLKTLRFMALITYFFAAFHKLNIDFFNPEVSCANDKMGEYLDLLPESWVILKLQLQQILPALGFLTEAVIPICLMIPRLRYFGILFQCGLHFLLAPLGFIDFSSLAMVLSWSFVDPKNIHFDVLTRRIQTLVYSCLALVIGLGLFRWKPQTEEFTFFEGTAFIAIFTPLIWQHVLPHLQKGHLTLPKKLFAQILLVLFFLYGFSNYLGLRTAGTFSMFSNLKTEGVTSNHLLLSSNPFKIFTFQEDMIEIVSVDEETQGFYRKMPYPGQLIPRVEFARILDILKKERRKNVSMEVIYENKTIKTDNAAYDPEFRFQVPAWQKKLFKFRAVRKEDPQVCMW